MTTLAKDRPGRTRPVWAGWLGVAPAILVLAVFLLGPIWVNLLESLKAPGSGALGIAQYLRIFGDAYYLTVIAQTLLFGLAVTAICLALG